MQLLGATSLAVLAWVAFYVSLGPAGREFALPLGVTFAVSIGCLVLTSLLYRRDTPNIFSAERVVEREKVVPALGQVVSLPWISKRASLTISVVAVVLITAWCAYLLCWA